jgi:hypothetical protein
MTGKSRGQRPGKGQATAAVESSAVELESFNPELGPLDLPQPDPLDLEILEAPGTAPPGTPWRAESPRSR